MDTAPLETLIGRASAQFGEGLHGQAFATILKGIIQAPDCYPLQSSAIGLIYLAPDGVRGALLAQWIAASRFGNLDNAAIILDEYFPAADERYCLGSFLGHIMVAEGDYDHMLAFFSLCQVEVGQRPVNSDAVVAEYSAKADAYESDQQNVRDLFRFCAFLGERLGARRDMAVVDIPCGTGAAGASLRPFAASLIGSDISPHMLARARESGVYDQLVEGDMLEILPGLDADLVVSHGSLYYFPDLAPVAGAVAKALRPGGLFAFTDFPAPEGTKVTVGGNARYCREAGLVRRVMADHGFAEEAMAVGLTYALPSLYWLFRKI